LKGRGFSRAEMSQKDAGFSPREIFKLDRTPVSTVEERRFNAAKSVLKATGL
jgi:hypothetical protein